jgi:hypothetical protein
MGRRTRRSFGEPLLGGTLGALRNEKALFGRDLDLRKSLTARTYTENRSVESLS